MDAVYRIVDTKASMQSDSMVMKLLQRSGLLEVGRDSPTIGSGSGQNGFPFLHQPFEYMVVGQSLETLCCILLCCLDT